MGAVNSRSVPTGGRTLFRDFLESEYCEENLDFWLACRDFGDLDGPEELRRRAESIYEEFVQANALRQVTGKGMFPTKHPGTPLFPPVGGQTPPFKLRWF